MSTLIQTLLSLIESGAFFNMPSLAALGESKFAKLLLSFHWPGNIRQVENIIGRIAVAGAGCGLDQLGPIAREILAKVNSAQLSHEEQLIKRQLEEALNQANGVKRQAARLLGRSETWVRRSIQRYGLRRAELKSLTPISSDLSQDTNSAIE